MSICAILVPTSFFSGHYLLFFRTVIDGMVGCLPLNDEFEGKKTFFGLRNSTVHTTFYLFSTGEGDVWLIEPSEKLALCLMWHYEPQVVFIEETSKNLDIGWDGKFDIKSVSMPTVSVVQPLGFYVETSNQNIKTRLIASENYPIVEIHELLKQFHP